MPAFARPFVTGSMEIGSIEVVLCVEGCCN